MGTTDPLDPDAGAASTTVGSTARKSVSSPKLDVRLDKLVFSEFLIFIHTSDTRTHFTQKYIPIY